MKNITNKQKILLSIIAIAITISVTAFSYAYFTATITNKTNPALNAITTGSMFVEYDEGQALAPVTGWVPGNYIEKTFSVENKGSVTAYYDIYINEVVNSFVDKNDLVYTLTSNDGGRNINQSVYPSSDTKIASNIELGVGQTHSYTFRVTFIEDNTNQNDNLGATFSGKIELKEGIRTKEIEYKYTLGYLEDNSNKYIRYDDYQTALSMHNIMVKQTLETNYITTDKVYGIATYEHLNQNGISYNSEEACLADLHYFDEGTASCYENNEQYYIKYFYVGYEEGDVDKFLTLSDCQAELNNWNAGSDTQCELMAEYDSERKIKINTRVLENQACYYYNNQINCLASLGEYDFDNEPSHVPTVVQNFINAHPEMECEYDGSTVGCILDDKFQISIDPWGLLNIFEIEAVYGPKKNNIPYNDYYTCVDTEDNYPVCSPSGGYFYAYDQDSDEYSTMAECESYHSVSNGGNGCGLKNFSRGSFSCAAGGGPENTCSGNEFI